MSEEGIVLSANAQKILDLVKELSVIELNALVKSLEEEFGVSAAAPVMMAGGAAGDDDGGSDTVTVELTEVGQQKIAVIKAVKEILGVGLKEAKEIVEKAPAPVKEGITSEEAETIQAKLQEAGATVTLK
jgi:large subunit ribosomal protein L7/L12